MAFSTPSALVYLEPCFWLAVLIAFLRLKDRSRFLFLGAFLAIRTFTTILLASLHYAHITATISYYVYWGGYFIGLVALFFSLQEIFYYAISPLAGLARIGGICFRWAAFMSLFVAIAAVLPSALVPKQTAHATFVPSQIAAGACALEMSLLAFLVITVRVLGFSVRSRISGLCIGLAIMAVGDYTSFSAQIAGAGAWLPALMETATFLCLMVWFFYLVLPEPEKRRQTAPAALLMEWNDLATALDPDIKTPARAQTSFLDDVENVVDRVLSKNAVKNIS